MNMKIRAAMLAGMALPLMSGVVLAGAPVGTGTGFTSGFVSKDFVNGTGVIAPNTLSDYITNNVGKSTVGAAAGSQCAQTGITCTLLVEDLAQGFIQQRVDVAGTSAGKIAGTYIRTIILDAPSAKNNAGGTLAQRFADESFVKFGGGASDFAGHNYLRDQDSTDTNVKKHSFFKGETNLNVGALKTATDAKTDLKQWVSDTKNPAGDIALSELTNCGPQAFCGAFLFKSRVGTATTAALDLGQIVSETASTGISDTLIDKFSYSAILDTTNNNLATGRSVVSTQELAMNVALVAEVGPPAYAIGDAKDGRMIFDHREVSGTKSTGSGNFDTGTPAFSNPRTAPTFTAAEILETNLNLQYAAGNKVSSTFIGQRITGGTSTSGDQTFGTQIVKVDDGTPEQAQVKGGSGGLFDDNDLGGTLGNTVWAWNATLFPTTADPIPVLKAK